MTDRERVVVLEEMVRNLQIQVMDLQHCNIFLRQTMENIRSEHGLLLPAQYREELKTEKIYRHKDTVMSAHIRKGEAKLKLSGRGK